MSTGPPDTCRVKSKAHVETMTGEDQEKVMPETREVRVKSERVGSGNQVVWISCPENESSGG